MYLNPFVAGVLSTIFVEAVSLVIYGFIAVNKDK